MELSVWTNTSIESVKWNEAEKRWTINLARIVDGTTTKCKLKSGPLDISQLTVLGTFHPKHVIQATGHSGEKYFPSYIKGIRDFKGDLLCHSSEFTSAKENGKGKKAVVVGCCNSAHDIAQDYVSTLRGIPQAANWQIVRKGV
jgi:cation diffusion facilitator CzcD-associated flavoprotein CzcO